MTYNFRSVVNHVLRKTEFGPVSESIDAQFTGDNVDPIIDRIKDWTNEVYTEICNSGYWRFLETEGTFLTVIGQETYPLATNCIVNRLINVREIKTPSILRRIDFKSIDQSYPDTSESSSGTPVYYYFQNNNMSLFPVPDSVMTIKYRYYKTVTEMIDATDIPLIPEHWKWVLVNGVLIRANQYLQDQSFADVQVQYFNGLLQMRAHNRADRQHKNSIQPY